MAVPGPQSEALSKRRKSILPKGLSMATPIYVDYAEGAKVWDVDGNEYVDFAGGIGVQNLGHRPAPVVEAIRAQLNRFIHTSVNVLPYELYIEAAEKLVALTPGNNDKKALFINSGAEAVENAVKIARTFTGRSAVVAFSHGFHGRTLLTMTLTGKAKPYRAGFGPMAPEVYHVPYPYPYRDPMGGRGDFGKLAAERLYALFETDVPAEQVAAVIVEPVAGEGGFIVPPADFLPRLREITQDHGILLIADEIQSGFGRTGKLFAVEHSGVVPDLMTVAKSLAAGMPLSAVVGRAEVMDAAPVGGLGGTYGGNPLALAAALAVMQSFTSDPNILARARHIGHVVQETFRGFAKRYPIVGDVRGLGAMSAMELVEDPKTRKGSAQLGSLVAQYSYQHGLILMRAGMQSNVIRTLMPLVITDAELEKGLQILDGALAFASHS